MHIRINITIASFAAIVALASLTGCGGGGDGGSAITASRASSVTVSGHNHSVDIPLSDVSTNPPDASYQFRSSDSNGHSHVIALTRTQMSDLANGERVTAVSSVPDVGPGHTHTWNLLGGNVLYDKYCYGCHGNGKRGGKPMKVKLSSAQNAAIRNPFGAPLSNALPATPNPDYQTAAAAVVPSQPEGLRLYQANCAPCHHEIQNTEIPNASAFAIKKAIMGNLGGMGFLSSLADAEIEAIADSLRLQESLH